MRGLNPDEAARFARLESQVAYLLRHPGIDPDLAAGQSGTATTFISPADILGTPASSAPPFGAPPFGAPASSAPAYAAPSPAPPAAGVAGAPGPAAAPIRRS